MHAQEGFYFVGSLASFFSGFFCTRPNLNDFLMALFNM